VVDVVLFFTVKFRDAIESHPTELLVVYVYKPLVVYVFPFQVNSSQTVMLIDDVELRLIVKFNVAVESHPTELLVEYVYVPLFVYVVPFHK